jgi:hypothetical protein
VTTRSSKFWAHGSSTAESVVVFECPAGTASLLKSIYGYTQGTTGDTNVLVYAGLAPAIIIINDPPIAAIRIIKWDGWIVLEPGDYVVVTNSSGGTVQTWGSGALLPLGST